MSETVSGKWNKWNVLGNERRKEMSGFQAKSSFFFFFFSLLYELPAAAVRTHPFDMSIKAQRWEVDPQPCLVPSSFSSHHIQAPPGSVSPVIQREGHEEGLCELSPMTCMFSLNLARLHKCGQAALGWDSYSYGNTWFARDLKDHLVPTPAMGRIANH